MNPFASYIGKTVTLQSRSYVVETSEVHGCELFFRLVEPASGKQCRLSALQLVELEERSELDATTVVDR